MILTPAPFIPMARNKKSAASRMSPAGCAWERRD